MGLKELLERKEIPNEIKKAILRETSKIERIRQERDALKENQDFFKKIFDDSPIGIETYDSSGLLINVNTSCLDIFGVSDIHDVKGFKLLEDPNIPEEVKAKLIKGEIIRFETTFDFDKVKNLQLYNTRKSGTIQLDVLITPLKSTENSLTGYLVQVQDITSLKEAFKELKEREEKTQQTYRMLVENMEAGVILQDKKSRVTYINPSLAKLIGQDQEDFIGKSMRPYVLTDEVEKLTKETEKRWRGVSTKFETVILTKDGKTIPIFVSSSPFLDNNGNYTGVLSVVTDISEQKKLQLLQDRFVATTSHELRTPITVIQGYLDFIHSHPELPLQEKNRIFLTLNSNIARLNRLISNVHDFSKINQRIFSISAKKINLDMFIREIREQIFLLFPKRSIFLDYIRYTDDPMISIDQDRILQLLQNLLSNAIKNSSMTTIVNIQIIRNTKNLQISVQDQGAGIPFVKLLQLFQPFSSSETRFSATGTGLGLYIVKTIVEAHEGSVEVLTKEEMGSIFTVNILAN